MDVYGYAQTIRGVGKLHGSWVLNDKDMLIKILEHLGKMDARLQKLFDLSFALDLVDIIAMSDPDDWEETLEYWAEQITERFALSTESARQICVLWLASMRKLPSFAMTSGTQGDILQVWSEPPADMPGGNLDNAINIAQSKDVILLSKGNYQLPDLAISRGRKLSFLGEGKLGDVIVEAAEGVYLLGNTALRCENIAFNTNRSLDKSSIFHLHKEANLTLKHCVIRSDATGVIAQDVSKVIIEDCKFSCREYGVLLRNEVQQEMLSDNELEDDQLIACRIGKTDFFQCGTALATFGSGFDVKIRDCNIHRSEKNALSLASGHSKIQIEKTNFINNRKFAIHIRDNSPTMRFLSVDNTYRDNKSGGIAMMS